MTTKKTVKAKTGRKFNPWPVCHPNCCTCTSLWEDYDHAEAESERIEEDVQEQLEDMASFKKDMARAIAALQKHVKTKEHQENIKEHDC